MSDITAHTVAVLARAPTTTLEQAASLIANFVAAEVSGAVLKTCEEDHARTMAILNSTKMPRETPEPQASPIYGDKWKSHTQFSVEEAGCEILGLSKCSAYAAAKSGELPTIRIGKRLVVPREALEKLLKGHYSLKRLDVPHA